MRWSSMIAAAACLSDVATAQPAQAGFEQSIAAQRVETRFAPPLGMAQRFRLTITKQGQTHSWVEEVRFERDGDAYVAHWRMDPASLPPAMKHPLLAPMIRPFTGAPLAFDLDVEGSVIGVRDWATQQARLLKSIEDSRPLLLAASGADKKEAETVLAATRAMFQQLDPQSGADIILKNLAPVFDWGGYGLTLDQPVMGTETVPVAWLGTSLDRLSTITLTALEPGIARITLRSEFEGTALRKMLEQLRTKVIDADPAAKARSARSMGQLDQMRAVQTTRVAIDLATGLPRRVEADVTRDGKLGQRTIIEWLKP